MKKEGMILLVISILIISFISAQGEEQLAGITPDSIFYGADVFFDNARAVLPPSSLGRAKIRLDIMGERMAEMEEMISKNKTAEAKRAELEGQKQMQKFDSSIRKVKKKDAMKLNEHIQIHAETLEILKQRFEDFGQPDYTDAIADAIKLLEESGEIIANIPEDLSPDQTFMMSAICQEAGATTAEECNELISSGVLFAPPVSITKETSSCTPGESCDNISSADPDNCPGGGSYWNYKTKWLCDDSDGCHSPEYIEHLGLSGSMLNYYYRKGTVEYKIITLKTGEIEQGIERDSCNGDTLTEWLCPTTISIVTRNERYSEEYDCPYGCEDGACITCNSDSICDQNEDCSCLDCEGERHFCDYAYVCQNGECVYEGVDDVTFLEEVLREIAEEEFEVECIEDSDGGKDYFVKGTVSYTSNLVPHTIVDLCVDDSRLAEAFCGDNNLLYIEIYSCPNGCEDGVCISN